MNSTHTEADLCGEAFHRRFLRGFQSKRGFLTPKSLRDGTAKVPIDRTNESNAPSHLQYIDLDQYGRGELHLLDSQDVRPESEKFRDSDFVSTARLTPRRFIKKMFKRSIGVPTGSTVDFFNASESTCNHDCKNEETIERGCTKSVAIGTEIDASPFSLSDPNPRQVQAIHGNHVDMTCIERGYVLRTVQFLESRSGRSGLDVCEGSYTHSTTVDEMNALGPVRLPGSQGQGFNALVTKDIVVVSEEISAENMSGFCSFGSVISRITNDSLTTLIDCTDVPRPRGWKRAWEFMKAHFQSSTFGNLSSNNCGLRGQRGRRQSSRNRVNLEVIRRVPNPSPASVLRSLSSDEDFGIERGGM